jgi:hypothetical protein
MTTCTNSEGSKFALSSSNNTVSNLHPQGVTQTSLQRERSQSHVESIHPQNVATTSLERERSQSHVERLHPKRCGADIPRNGELKVTRGESGPVGDRVVGCARSCIEDASDGVPRANIRSFRRGGPEWNGNGRGKLGRHQLKWPGSGASGAARNTGWRLLASGATGIGASSRGVELGVRGGI